MLRKEPERQQSFYCVLYDKIPEDHILKKVSTVVDFSFINELLEGSYCKNFGRPAKEPKTGDGSRRRQGTVLCLDGNLKQGDAKDRGRFSVLTKT